jgi:adenylylsulfate kinase
MHTDFTGISAPYEEPVKPELVIDTDSTSVDDAVKSIVKYLEEQKYI